MDDVCLILEGTYPYVSGGVSSWIYEIIRRLPDTTFSIVFIGANRSSTKRRHYPVPSNVRDFREFYLFDYRVKRNGLKRTDLKAYRAVEAVMRDLRTGNTESFEEAVRAGSGHPIQEVNLYDLVHGKEGWRILKSLYDSEDHEASFLDYFWTWRYLYLPFFSLIKINLPQARVYHAPSTGYAGLLGSVAKIRTKRPFLITEHGIYTRERKIDISTSDWIYNEYADEVKIIEQQDIFREWWISLFSTMSRLAYAQADEIFTLYGGNVGAQIRDGADPKKIRVIPNGIEIPKKVESIKEARPLTLALIGRVVPIKDIKTFIRACIPIRDKHPDVRIWILGPTDEDPEYFEECRLLIEMNKLEDTIEFKGKVKLSEYFPQIDITVLTSISEGQPLVTLEGYAYEIPAVMTDVGSCSELAMGSNAEDRLLGPSALITPVCDPTATSHALIRLIENPELRQQMGRSARKRVLRFYQVEDMIARYQHLYNHYTEEVRW